MGAEDAPRSPLPGGTEAKCFYEDGCRGTVNTARFNVDGNYAVSGGSDRRLRLWNVKKGTLVKVYKGHTDDIAAAVFSSGNERLASSGGEKNVYVWDIATGETPLRKLRGHQARTNALAFGAGDQVLATGSHDATVRLWDLRAARSLDALQSLTAATAPVTSVALHDCTLTTASIDGFIRWYDIRTGGMVTDAVGHAVCCHGVSTDSRLLLASCLDSCLRLFDASSGDLLNTFVGHDNTTHQLRCAFTPDGSLAYSGGTSGVIVFWDVVTGAVVHSLHHSRVRKEVAVPAVDYHPSEPVLLTGGVDGLLKVFEAASPCHEGE